MATFDSTQLILLNFEELSLNSYVVRGKRWQTLHNTASNGTVWPHLEYGDHIWSRIFSMKDLVHIKAEVRNLVLRYQVMARWHAVAR